MAEKKNTFSNTCCRVLSKQTEKALEVKEFSTENGGEVQMYDFAGSDSQLWSFVPAGQYFKLICKLSGKALDIIAAGVNDGAWVHQWEAVEGAESQLWSVEDAGDGFYKIKSKLSGKCLDIVDMCADNGARVQIWEDMNGDNQKWKLLSVEESAEEPAAKKSAVKRTVATKAKVETAPKAAASKAPAKKAEPVAAAKSVAKPAEKAPVKAAEKTTAKRATKK